LEAEKETNCTPFEAEQLLVLGFDSETISDTNKESVTITIIHEEDGTMHLSDFSRSDRLSFETPRIEGDLNEQRQTESDSSYYTIIPDIPETKIKEEDGISNDECSVSSSEYDSSYYTIIPDIPETKIKDEDGISNDECSVSSSESDSSYYTIIPDIPETKIKDEDGISNDECSVSSSESEDEDYETIETQDASLQTDDDMFL
jgi:hypothetical protein